MKMVNDLPEYYQERIEQTGDCWIWIGSMRPDGYGRGHHLGPSGMAHRLVYEILVSQISEGLQLDHLCRTLRCVNPAHLEPVSGLENQRRRYADYTHCSLGHELTKANTYRRPVTGHRDCRACIRERARRYRQRKASAA